MKVFYILCAIIVVIVGFFFLQTKWNRMEIARAMQSGDYTYYCVVDSASITTEDNQTTTTIDNNKINLGNLWGDLRMSADGSYAVIFTNDLTNAIKIDVANREMIAELSDKKIPFCAEIKKP